MEIKGDEFLRNVQVRQEEEILRQKLGEFDTARQSSSSNPYSNQEYVNTDPYNENELGDILLKNTGKSAEYQDNKKKYIVLGVALVLLFVITIVIIRLIGADSTSNDVKTQEQSALEQDKALSDDKIQQEYQELLNNKLKSIDGTATPDIPKEGLDSIKTLESQEENIPSVEPSSNPLNVTKKAVEVSQEEPASKPTQKAVQKEIPVQKTAPSSTSKADAAVVSKGIYVQVGAYSNKPNDKFLADIEAKGYGYKINTVSSQGKELHKLLIGPYKSRSELSNLSAIKKTFNAPGAFIVEF